MIALSKVEKPLQHMFRTIVNELKKRETDLSRVLQTLKDQPKLLRIIEHGEPSNFVLRSVCLAYCSEYKKENVDNEIEIIHLARSHSPESFLIPISNERFPHIFHVLVQREYIPDQTIAIVLDELEKHTNNDLTIWRRESVEDHDTALHSVCREFADDAIVGRLKIFEDRERKGVLDIQNQKGYTVLHILCENAEPENFQLVYLCRDLYPAALAIPTRSAILPVHIACRDYLAGTNRRIDLHDEDSHEEESDEDSDEEEAVVPGETIDHPEPKTRLSLRSDPRFNKFFVEMFTRTYDVINATNDIVGDNTFRDKVISPLARSHRTMEILDDNYRKYVHLYLSHMHPISTLLSVSNGLATPPFVKRARSRRRNGTLIHEWVHNDFEEEDVDDEIKDFFTDDITYRSKHHGTTIVTCYALCALLHVVKYHSAEIIGVKECRRLSRVIDETTSLNLLFREQKLIDDPTEMMSFLSDDHVQKILQSIEKRIMVNCIYFENILTGLRHMTSSRLVCYATHNADKADLLLKCIQVPLELIFFLAREFRNVSLRNFREHLIDPDTDVSTCFRALLVQVPDCVLAFIVTEHPEVVLAQFALKDSLLGTVREPFPRSEDEMSEETDDDAEDLDDGANVTTAEHVLPIVSVNFMEYIVRHRHRPRHWIQLLLIELNPLLSLLQLRSIGRNGKPPFRVLPFIKDSYYRDKTCTKYEWYNTGLAMQDNYFDDITPKMGNKVNRFVRQTTSRACRCLSKVLLSTPSSRSGKNESLSRAVCHVRNNVAREGVAVDNKGNIILPPSAIVMIVCHPDVQTVMLSGGYVVDRFMKEFRQVEDDVSVID